MTPPTYPGRDSDPACVPLTNSTELLCPMARFSSALWRISCCVLKSSSLYPQPGRLEASHMSLGNVVEYCAMSSIPACSLNLTSKLGFLSDVEPASFSLKCTPCFFSDRKCANLAFAPGSGEPGGDGGISRFGTGGRVKSCMDVRTAEKCDGSELCDCSCKPSNSSRPDGPRTGPLGSMLAGNSGFSLDSAWLVRY